jgi:hypothetical protein
VTRTEKRPKRDNQHHWGVVGHLPDGREISYCDRCKQYKTYGHGRPPELSKTPPEGAKWL